MSIIMISMKAERTAKIEFKEYKINSRLTPTLILNAKRHMEEAVEITSAIMSFKTLLSPA